MSETVIAWEIKACDLIILNGAHYVVLNKSLIPLGDEIGFCLNLQEQGRKERSWQVFRWNEQITRIN